MVSTWFSSKWLLKFCFEWKFFSHWLHWNESFSQWLSHIWFDNFGWVSNSFLQISHLKSSLFCWWVLRMWPFRRVFRLKGLSQNSQRNFFLWTTSTWKRQADISGNCLEHFIQKYFTFFFLILCLNLILNPKMVKDECINYLCLFFMYFPWI